MQESHRRRFLRTVGAAGIGVLAGCNALDDGDDDVSADGDGASGGDGGGTATGSALAGDSWPTVGQTPRNDAHAGAAAGPGTSPAVRWRFRAGAPDGGQASRVYYSSPVASDGTVFATVSGTYTPTDGEGRESFTGLVALDARGGDREWRNDVIVSDVPTTSVAPVVVGDAVVLTTDGVVVGVDAATGERRFRTALRGSAAGPTVADADGTAYLPRMGGESDRVVAFDVAAREVVWSAPLSLPVRTPPAAVTDRAVVVGLEDGVVALDRETGTERWRRDLGTPTAVPAATPVATDRGVFVAASAPAATRGLPGALLALDHDGSERWRFSPGDGGDEVGGAYGLPVLVDGRLHVVGAVRAKDDTAWRTALYGLDPADGSRAYRAAMEMFPTQLVAAGGTVFGLAGGTLRAFAASDGSPVGSGTMEGAPAAGSRQPALVDEVVVATTLQGLVAFGPADPS